MDEAALNDLKEFITVTVSQQLTLHLDEVKDEFKREIRASETRLSKQIQDLSDSVAEAMTTQNDEVDKQLKNHETRISALEAKPA